MADEESIEGKMAKLAPEFFAALYQMPKEGLREVVREASIALWFREGETPIFRTLPDGTRELHGWSREEERKSKETGQAFKAATIEYHRPRAPVASEPAKEQ